MGSHLEVQVVLVAVLVDDGDQGDDLGFDQGLLGQDLRHHLPAVVRHHVPGGGVNVRRGAGREGLGGGARRRRGARDRRGARRRRALERGALEEVSLKKRRGARRTRA